MHIHILTHTRNIQRVSTVKQDNETEQADLTAPVAERVSPAPLILSS